MLKKVERAYDLFKEIYNNDSTIIEKEELTPLENKFKETNYYSADIPRIMLMGEFKAGKSTLLNALFGKNVAATDIFEMTSWVARYWYAKEEFCKITYKDKSEEFVSPEEFYQKCSQRTLEKTDLIDRVDVGVNSDSMICSIIDTPGFGSTTVENENRMLNAIEEADYIFWVLSCEAIGGMKEAAIVEKTMSKGVPLVCVLTKCDYMDDGEFDEVAEYLNSTLNIDKTKIFPVSALEYMNNPSNIKQKENMENLRRFIKNNIIVRKSDLRKQAQEGYIKILKEHCVNILHRLIKDVDLRIDSMNKYSALLESVRDDINLRTENMLVEYVNSTMYNPHRQTIAEKLNALHGKITEKDIQNVFLSVLPKNYLDEYWNNTATHLQKFMVEEWEKSLNENIDEISKCKNQIYVSSNTPSANINIEKEIKDQVSLLDNYNTKTGLMTTLGIAGVCSMYVAAIGPAASAITAGMAISGIGIPIALMGLGVTAALHFFSKNNKNKKNELDSETIIQQNIDFYVENIIKKKYMENVRNINTNYKRVMLEKYEEDMCKYFSKNKLSEIKKEYEQVLNNLN